ncbi:MAG: hypothetical protein IJ228_08420 [Succinivibrio sp.]|nr:hypothetical protein [Succinivibrio sp.]
MALGQTPEEYLKSLQHPAGWFELVQTIVEMVAENAQGDNNLAFLEEVGRRVAASYPLNTVKKLSELNVAFNNHLYKFNWGYVDIEDAGDSLIFRHHCMPLTGKPDTDAVWQRSFCAVLLGLYNVWLHQSGSPKTLHCDLVRLTSNDGAVFRLKRRNPNKA